MTFPLEFDLLMIRVCTFLQKKKKKKKRHVYVSYLTPLGFCCWVHHWGLGEIFMKDELYESSLRSFVPWIMDDMYWIGELSNLLLRFSDHLSSLPFHHW